MCRLVVQSFCVVFDGVVQSFCAVSDGDVQSFGAVFLCKEGYCSALRQLKEGLERPMQEASAFIGAMSVQLSEFTAATPQTPSPPPPYIDNN
ncbi:hypothetical protein U1Q18_001996 [Sarracenia purpurea var. burkii]